MTDAATRAATLLAEHRDSIDRLDAILVYTLAERFKQTQAVGRLKAVHDLPPETDYLTIFDSPADFRWVELQGPIRRFAPAWCNDRTAINTNGFDQQLPRPHLAHPEGRQSGAAPELLQIAGR